MPTYFFDIHQADGRVDDDTIGAEFPDNAHALKEAERALGDMAADAAHDPKAQEIKVTVRDDLGQIVGYRAANFESENFDG
ncbi:hypothetical protein NIM87_09675 [Devosia sp. XJ19-1]|uniref:DUF6894 domain-containing protein n=1 Tax=Devosia ureilytica TaxID=2952754 RepID=A0A9Q4APC3_9HYPH|nr:hypothetical protein [Devosia ureilytica]MCP8883767.1 hypothetical protein [Devosia ureilytica]MCP8887375.1 hypothetical protein [Devosia ureilytica]